MIEAFAGDGSRYDLSVQYSYDGETLLGTGGALKRAQRLLGETFMVVYGDSWLDTDYGAIAEAYRNSDKRALMTVFRNEGAWDTSNVEYDGTTIRRYDKRVQTPQMQFIDWGLGVLGPGAFDDWAGEEKFDLADLYGRLVEQGQLAGYAVKQRFYEIGSAAGLAETDAFLRQTERPTNTPR